MLSDDLTTPVQEGYGKVHNGEVVNIVHTASVGCIVDLCQQTAATVGVVLYHWAIWDEADAVCELTSEGSKVN